MVDNIIIICITIILIIVLDFILERFIAYKWAKIEKLKEKYQEKYFK